MFFPVNTPPPHIPWRLAINDPGPKIIAELWSKLLVVSQPLSCKFLPGAKNDKCIKCLPISPLSEYVLVSTPTPKSVGFPVIPLSHLLGPPEWSSTVVTIPSNPFIWFFLMLE